MSLVFLNGALVPEAEARVSVRDRGFLYGDSVFETLPVYSGRVFLLAELLSRLVASASRILLPLPWTVEELAQSVTVTIGANSLDRGSLRLTISRGTGPPGIDPLAHCQPTLVIAPAPARDHTTDRERGVAVVISSVPKASAEAIPADAKAGNWLNHILARRDASEAGAFEALLLHADGSVAEGTVSNAFAVRGGTVATPPADGRILPGITRWAVLRLLAELGIPAEERVLLPDDLHAADEVWITNSLIEILPACSLDGEPLASPWPLCRHVQQAYTDWVRRECSGGR